MTIWSQLKKPIFALAPMEDVTDTVFRQIVGQCAAPDLYFTEFLSCDGYCSAGRESVSHRLKYSPSEQPLIAQVWGKKPENYYKTILDLKDRGFAGVDINMGCPVKKVIKSGQCSALINDHALAADIIQASYEAAGSDFPVSVKTRIGFNKIDTENWIGFLLEHPLKAITVHGRIAKQMSEGKANWSEIGRAASLRSEMKKDILILGNGDVASYQDGLDKIKMYDLDGVMIGRGVFSNLFVFDPRGVVFEEASIKERLDLFLVHARLFNQTWSDRKKNINILKKFVKIYVSVFTDAAILRNNLMEASSLQDIEDMVTHFLQEHSF
jgi:tRNA-dihydrouridine synthase